MAYGFFYIYLLLIWVVLFICSRCKDTGYPHLIIGITSAAYSLAFDMLFGDWLKLYYYLDTANSAFFMVLSGIFIYPVLNIIYTLFLPAKSRHIIFYTAAWIAGMLIFEYLTIFQKIIVLTGWTPMPMSLLLYAFTYLWINMFIKKICPKVL